MDLYSDARRAAHHFQRPRHTDPVPLSYRELVRRGVSPGRLRWLIRRAVLCRPQHGLYLPGPAGSLIDRAQTALTAAGPHAVLGFHTAALLHGFGVIPSSSIHLIVPSGTPVPQRSGITSHTTTRPLSGVSEIAGLPCVAPERCAIDLARTLPRSEALPVLDAALFAGAVETADLLRELPRHHGLRGIRQARDLVMLADGRPECRQESQLRLVLLDAGITDFVPQLPVVDQYGRARHRLDLGDPEHLIAAEYDGSSHLDPQRLRGDRARHNWLEEHGWAVRYFTSADLYQSPEEIVRIIKTARRSRENRRI